MQIKQHHSSGETGSVAVIAIVGMLAFLIMAALVVDVGLIYLRKVQISQEAEAAALAGVQHLPEDPAAAVESAREYAEKNSIGSENVISTIMSNNRELMVSVTIPQSLIFARLAGLDSVTLRAYSKARVSSVSSVTGARPFGVIEQQFVYGDRYFLKYGPGPGSLFRAGNFGALALGGTGASNYRSNIISGYSGRIRRGQWIDTETGNMSGPTRDAVRQLLTSCPHQPKCTFDNYVRDCPMVLTVPIISSESFGGRTSVQVLGFAAFFIEDELVNSGNSYVVGRFVERALDFEGDGGNSYGLKSFALVE